MTRPLAALLLVGTLLSSGAWAVSAQTATPTPTTTDSPFQVVSVGGLDYRVDPFFPCQGYVTERTTRLGTDGVVSTVTLLLFIRDGEDMTPLEPFSTVDNELTQMVEVGRTFVCAPQTAVDSEALDG